MDAVSRRTGAIASSVANRGRAIPVFDALGPVALFAVVAVSRNTEHFRLMVGEDGILEWTQVAGFVVAVWALFSAGARVVGRTRVAYLSCGALVLGVIGEELAWGTRLMGSGVELVEARNEQGDTTLHNLEGILEMSFVGIVTMAIVLAVLVVIRWTPFRNAPLTLVWWLMVPAAYAAYRVGVGEVPYHIAKLSEAAEVVFALAVARLALCARGQQSVPPPTG